jgi:rhomboid protease GluP
MPAAPHTMPETPVRRAAMPSSQPVVTYVLLAANIIVFVADSVMGLLGLGLQGVGPLTLLGAKNNLAILDGEYWRLVTPLFLHGGIIHLGFNSYFLYVVGRQIERLYGPLRFAAIYFLSGIAGTMASFAFNTAPAIGASGALFGLIGAWLPLLYRNRHILANTQRQIRSIVQVIVINLLIGLTPGIDNWAHVGGLVGGLALGWLITPRYALRGGTVGDLPEVVDQTDAAQGIALAGLFAFVLAAIMLGLVLLRQ